MNFQKNEKTGFYEGFALVKSCDKKTAKNGSFFLDAVLGDKDGEIFAKMWDYREENTPLPQANTIVKVRGMLQQYNGNDQFIIQRMRVALPEDGVNPSDFVKTADCSGADMLNTILGIVNGFKDTELKAVVLGMLQDNKTALLTFPAAEKLHHAMRWSFVPHPFNRSPCRVRLRYLSLYRSRASYFRCGAPRYC